MANRESVVVKNADVVRAIYEITSRDARLDREVHVTPYTGDPKQPYAGVVITVAGSPPKGTVLVCFHRTEPIIYATQFGRTTEVKRHGQYAEQYKVLRRFLSEHGYLT